MDNKEFKETEEFKLRTAFNIFTDFKKLEYIKKNIEDINKKLSPIEESYFMNHTFDEVNSLLSDRIIREMVELNDLPYDDNERKEIINFLKENSIEKFYGLFKKYIDLTNKKYEFEKELQNQYEKIGTKISESVTYSTTMANFDKECHNGNTK